LLGRRKARAIVMVKILMLTGDAGEAEEIYYAKFRLGACPSKTLLVMARTG
jgi:hypothetical protein